MIIGTFRDDRFWIESIILPWKYVFSMLANPHDPNIQRGARYTPFILSCSRVSINGALIEACIYDFYNTVQVTDCKLWYDPIVDYFLTLSFTLFCM